MRARTSPMRRDALRVFAVGEARHEMVWEGVGSARGRPQAGRTSREKEKDGLVVCHEADRKGDSGRRMKEKKKRQKEAEEEEDDDDDDEGVEEVDAEEEVVEKEQKGKINEEERGEGRWKKG